jgi:hypothetical protein
MVSKAHARAGISIATPEKRSFEPIFTEVFASVVVGEA